MKGKSRTIIATLVGIAFSGAVQAALVAEWNFDGQTLVNSGTSGSVHDGGTPGAPVFTEDTPSGSGYALDLSGSAGYMWVTNSATNHTGYVDTFDAPTSFSYSMWVKSPTGSWDGWDVIAGKGYQDEVNISQEESVGWDLRGRNFSSEGTMLDFWIPNATVTVVDEDPFVSVNDQLWHLLTYTYDGTTEVLTLYVDGEEKGSSSGVMPLTASGYMLMFDVREKGNNKVLDRQPDCLYDSIQFYDNVLSASEVAGMYIPQADLFVDSDAITFGLLSPDTLATGSVAIAYLADTSVEVAVSVSDESHLSAFSLVNTTPMTLTDPSPSNTVLEFAFDNAVTGLIDGESATGLVTIAWNVTGDTEVTEIVLPISVTYEVPAPAPILWDINTTAGGSSSTVADFAAAGVTESLAGATVSNVEGAQNMTDGVITVDLSNYDGNFAPGATYTGAGASIMNDYVYQKGTSVITIGGLGNRLVANTEYSLYLWGKGDANDQQATFTFEETSITTATNDVFTSDATNFMAKFSFTTDVTVPESLEVTWAKVAPYVAFNGFALLPKYSLNPIVGAISSELVSGGTEMALSFDTTLGSLYSVEAIDDLVNGTWSDIVTDVEGTDGTVTITNTISATAEFYRAYIQD